MITTPEVHLLAHTTTTDEANQLLDRHTGTTDAEHLTTLAGRACYQSFHRPSPATHADADYITKTVHGSGHWSIVEHASATVYITGVSRAFTHELIRHRHLSYSQLSQRFVNEEEANIVRPPAIECGAEISSLENVAETAFQEYELIVNSLTDDHNLPRKQAREAARAVLPNMTETRIVVTGNLRAWKEVIDRRTQPDADAEMREVMGMVRETLTPLAPTIFKENQ